MQKVKLDILNPGGKLYYTDTDSIVTDIKLPDHLLGNALGQFKLEHRGNRSYYISNKTYCLIKGNKMVKLAVKGGDKNSVTKATYIDYLNH